MRACCPLRDCRCHDRRQWEQSAASAVFEYAGRASLPVVERGSRRFHMVGPSPEARCALASAVRARCEVAEAAAASSSTCVSRDRFGACARARAHLGNLAWSRSAHSSNLTFGAFSNTSDLPSVFQRSLVAVARCAGGVCARDWPDEAASAVIACDLDRAWRRVKQQPCRN